MRVEPLNPPRRFQAGMNHSTVIDCARIQLEASEQVTFVTENGSEYDVARHSWGFYATPSLNNRLPKYGFRPVLVRNVQGRYYLLLVEHGKNEDFDKYLRDEQETVIAWLDETAVLDAMALALTDNRRA